MKNEGQEPHDLRYGYLPKVSLIESPDSLLQVFTPFKVVSRKSYNYLLPQKENVVKEIMSLYTKIIMSPINDILDFFLEKWNRKMPRLLRRDE